jgi:hypothetical protein
MNLFNVIKTNYLNKYLKNRKTLRNKEIISLDKAKAIGIISEISDEDSYKHIYSLFTKLQTSQKSVWLMCYVDNKEVPYYCLQQLTADYFSKKNLNWFGKPDFIQMKDFIAKDFDMLIDLNEHSFPSIKYILAQTNAKFLVGSVPEHQSFYDLYIKMEERTDKIEILKNIHIYTKKLTGE